MARRATRISTGQQLGTLEDGPSSLPVLTVHVVLRPLDPSHSLVAKVADQDVDDSHSAANAGVSDNAVDIEVSDGTFPVSWLLSQALRFFGNVKLSTPPSDAVIAGEVIGIASGGRAEGCVISNVDALSLDDMISDVVASDQAVFALVAPALADAARPRWCVRTKRTPLLTELGPTSTET